MVRTASIASTLLALVEPAADTALLRSYVVLVGVVWLLTANLYG